MLDEGRASTSGGADLSENFEDEECEHLDSEISDPDEETLPPGEMEMIFENCFIMWTRLDHKGLPHEAWQKCAVQGLTPLRPRQQVVMHT
jgi:hypothetical protein